VERARAAAGIQKRLTPHTLRHSSPLTSWRRAPTCATTRSCSATRAPRRPRSVRTFRKGTSRGSRARSTITDSGPRPDRSIRQSGRNHTIVNAQPSVRIHKRAGMHSLRGWKRQSQTPTLSARLQPMTCWA
jgi:hypothetical protein